MIITYNWNKYTKEISTNQLILKGENIKNNIIRLGRNLFKINLNKGHSSIIKILEGNPIEVSEKYKLFENNFKRLLKKYYPENFQEVNSETSIDPSKRLVYSKIYDKEIHKNTIKLNCYYITLV